MQEGSFAMKGRRCKTDGVDFFISTGGWMRARRILWNVFLERRPREQALR